MPRRVASEVKRFVKASLIYPQARPAVENDSARNRRRIVVAATLAVGAVALGLALSIRPGDPLFYPATLSVAAIWVLGALASGPLRLGTAATRDGRTSRGVLQGALLGGALLIVFLVGAALVVAPLPELRGPVEELLDHARFGSLWIVAVITAVSGVAEELFFRGAAFSAFPSRFRIPATTAIYAASTLFAGIPLLTFAAACLGLLTATQRRVTGGVLGPIASHLTWSLGMLILMPWALTLGS